jgi:EmrB/QacA subfamily drug resistance transporter
VTSRPAPSIRIVFLALGTVVLLAALDQTILATALPTIVGDLGGLAHLTWVITAYVLAGTVVIPLYGKLGDLFGRKIVLQAAIVIFLVGSLLCGLAQNMTELIVYRSIQGLGGGGLFPVATAIIGDVIAPRERGRYQGIFASIFGVATVIGPLLGGFFVEHLSWRWIFFVNIPLCVVALLVIGIVFHSPAVRGKASIDYAGAVAMTGALTSIVLFTSLGGTTWPWASAQSIALLVCGVVLTLVFVACERRAAEPILPLQLFRNRVFSAMSAVTFVMSVMLFGAITYLPLFLQVVMGLSPTRAGLLQMPMTVGVICGSITAGRLSSRTGRYKGMLLGGIAVAVVGVGLLSRLGVDTSIGYVLGASTIVGLGVGLSFPMQTIAVQNAVPLSQMGVGTSGALLFRQVGASVGLAAFGALFANRLTSYLVQLLPPGVRPLGNASPAALHRLPPALHQPYVTAVAEAVKPVFVASFVVGIVAFALAWLVREVPLRSRRGAESDAVEPVLSE